MRATMTEMSVAVGNSSNEKNNDNDTESSCDSDFKRAFSVNLYGMYMMIATLKGGIKNTNTACRCETQSKHNQEETHTYISYI